MRLYDFNNPNFSELTGHFTQLVWAGTTQVGCAIGVCPNGVQVGASTWNGKLYVCEYSAAGNVWGYFRSNVFPASRRRAEL